MRNLLGIVVIACFTSGLPSLFAAEKATAIWADGHSSAVSDEELVGNTTAAPGAAYPEEAQKAKTTGSGVYELRIDKAGKISAVAIVKSSGSAVLDKAATTAFKKWRFKPGVFQSVRIPVSWSVNRVR
ncbi:MAG: energy transducer TonB [Chthoniobacterales bacterium]